jgi:hypothetical protein
MFSYLCRDMQKVINELINNSLKGVDTYRWRDATWLIFSEEHRWVIELTDGGTLWFNYKFFDNVLRYVSLDPNEGSKYITGWAEGYFFRKNDGWKILDSNAVHRENVAVSIVNRGVKTTEGRGKNHGDEFEWHTRAVVDNGVKKVQGLNSDSEWSVRNAMNIGIKVAKPNVVFHGIDNKSMSYVPCSGNVTDIWMIVEEGIKNVMPSKATSKSGIHYDDLMCNGNRTDVSLIVEQGIKNTYPDMIPGDYNWQDEFNAEKVIQNGNKLVHE